MGCGCAHWCRGGICSHFTPLPRDRSALGRRAAPTTWWGARQGCRAWGGGGCVSLSTPLLYPPPARINIYGWAEWGGLQGKAKLEGWGGGGGRNCGGPLVGGWHQPEMSPARGQPSHPLPSIQGPFMARPPPPAALGAGRPCAPFSRAVYQYFAEFPLNKWQAVFKHSAVIINSPHIPLLECEGLIGSKMRKLQAVL